MTLHSVLGIPRVKKRSSSSATKRSSSSATPTWTASLARTKPGTGATRTSSNKAVQPRDDSSDRYHQRLPNLGPASLPVPLPSLPTSGGTASASASAPNPIEIHEHILATMFSPLPGNGTGKGLGSARIAAVLQFRAAVPRVVSVPHLLQALLSCSSSSSSSSPAAAERAIAATVRRGEGRRVRIPTLAGGAAGSELFVRAAELEALVGRCAALREDRVGERFLAWLGLNPGRERLVEEEGGLGRREVDALVKAGFLTAVNGHGACGGGSATGGAALRARPEARYNTVSLETVARAAAGSAAAVGGEGVLHAAGGTGARSLGPAAEEPAGSEFSVAVPGSGVFLKLASAALEHLADLLRKTPYREMSESDLREKWDGGVVGDSDIAQAKKSRGEFAGVMPGRTKKWKEFHGLAFDWVLREAVGAGVVEVFETQSVGRGVRLV
ncbi:serine-threonine protein kinase 19-domain-containing protein [Thermothelomyces heterothallicus CBS 202.75]|uniref:serine-threonine protein kinase 19-domain-containing protein n=1 Tax=Thermothelomyces heterothallicus CBS 202.75 TaxID=1149848 RepID=UPI003743EDD9